MMIKILHTSDLHLDSPLSSNEKYPIKKQDLRDVFNNIVNIAKEQKVNMVLISGDLFDNETVTIETRNIIKSVLAKANDIYFFIISGNHDYYKKGSVYEDADFPSNVILFNNGCVEKYEIKDLNTVVYGVGLNEENSSLHLIKDFIVEDTTKINLMLFHGNLVSNNTNAEYFPLTKDEIQKSELDYLALGHIHKAGTVEKIGNTYYAYSGIPQGRGFDELSDKGVIIGNISKGQKSFEFINTCKKTFNIIELDVSDVDTIYDIINLINEKINNSENKIYRILLIGQIPKNLHIDTTSIIEGINVDYIEVQDNTTILEDIKALMNENTLKGLFIKNMLEQEHTEENKIYEDALRIGLDALSC